MSYIYPITANDFIGAAWFLVGVGVFLVALNYWVAWLDGDLRLWNGRRIMMLIGRIIRGIGRGLLKHPAGLGMVVGLLILMDVVAAVERWGLSGLPDCAENPQRAESAVIKLAPAPLQFVSRRNHIAFYIVPDRQVGFLIYTDDAGCVVGVE